MALYRQGLCGRVIVSGAIGVQGFDEALAMRDYLLSRQIPMPAILIDSTGINTQATAMHSAALMNRFGSRSAIVVTQFFHVTRARRALHAAGIVDVRSAHARYFEPRDAYSLLRETAALIKYTMVSTVS